MIVRDIIKYENGDFLLTGQGEVWMTVEEIADLLNVLGASVRRTTKGILDIKSMPIGNGYYYADLYNLEVIIALAHKFDNANTRLFRKWLAERLSDICLAIWLRLAISHENCTFSSFYLENQKNFHNFARVLD